MRAGLEMRLRLEQGRFTLDAGHASGARVVGIYGPSGSGKTTWLEAVAGLRRGARGYIRCGETVWLDSARGLCVPASGRGIGYVPQDCLLFPHRSVRGNLRSGLRRAVRAGEGEAAARMEEVIAVLELEELLAGRVSELSGGERQRVALGRALCSGPQLLLLDEPLASLDGGLRRRILPFLLRVRDHFEVPMVIVSHNALEMQTMCEEVVVVRAGKVTATGSPGEVLTRPGTYGGADGEGYENILPACVTGHREDTTALSLGKGGGGPQVRTLRLPCEAGARVFLGIRASDVLVATGALEGLSARNRLKAVIASIRPMEDRAIATLELAGAGEVALIAELTREAVRELGLSAGRSVYVFMKSSAFRLYG